MRLCSSSCRLSVRGMASVSAISGPRDWGIPAIVMTVGICVQPLSLFCTDDGAGPMRLVVFQAPAIRESTHRPLWPLRGHANPLSQIFPPLGSALRPKVLSRDSLNAPSATRGALTSLPDDERAVKERILGGVKDGKSTHGTTNQVSHMRTEHLLVRQFGS